MREMLFRGRRIDNGKWVCSGNILTFVDDHVKTVYIAGIREKCVCTHDEADNVTGIEGCVFYKVDPETVGEWTGLYDENKNEIYEGDIICYIDEPGEIVYVEEEAMYYIDFGCWYTDFDHISGASCEVIGNIHDNPELLGDQP